MSTLGLKHKTVFSSNQEREMKDYIRQAAEIAMGMTGDEVRSFAYKCGIYFNVEMPVSWDEDMKVGKKWLKLYLKRNDLTYRKAELTSYNRLLGWNQEATNAFYGKSRGTLWTLQIQTNENICWWWIWCHNSRRQSQNSDSVWCKACDKSSCSRKGAGPRLNKKDGLTRYGDSHVKDKTS